MISQSVHTGITGVVLAGGLSTRMGKDKTGIRLHGASEPDMLMRTCNMLSEITDEVWIAGRNKPESGSQYLWLPDETPRLGPIGGITTALRAAQGPVLVLSCDLPFMELSILNALFTKRAEHPDALMTTFLQAETGFVEALVAIYEFEALPLFDSAITEGVYKLSRVVPKAKQACIPYQQHESLPFFNVNYPADLEMARRIINAI